MIENTDLLGLYRTMKRIRTLSDGTLAEILVAEGKTVAVGALLGRAAMAERPGSELLPAFALSPISSPTLTPPPTAAPATSLAPMGSLGRIRTIPLAHREARLAKVHLSALVGTGRRRRVKAIVRAVATRSRQGGSAPEARALQLPQGRLSFRMWEPDEAAHATVLMLHGFADDAQIWSAPAANLARAGSRVVAPDLSAHGDTTIPADGLDDMVSASIALAERLGLTTVDLVGHAMGAAVACKIARWRPDLVRRLTLLAPMGLGGDIDGDLLAGMAVVTGGRALAHLLRRLAVQPPAVSPDRLDAMAAGLGGSLRLAGLARALVVNGRQQVDVVADLQSIDRPTRILWGLEDRIVPWQHALQAPSHVARHFFRGAGHMLHWDQPEDTVALLAAGLKGRQNAS